MKKEKIYKNKLSVVHINKFDITGGAAKVAWRLSEYQREQGHSSTSLVEAKHSESKYSVGFSADFDKDFQYKCVTSGDQFYEIQGSHSLVSNPLVKAADIIHIHNTHSYYFNPFSLSLLSHLKPIVWTLHDMYAITGHCSHSLSCERWKFQCGNCPDLEIYPDMLVDNTANMLKDKKLIYDHSFFYVVTPSNWLYEKVQQSILKNNPLFLIYNGVDTNLFKPFPKYEMRKKFNIPSDAFVIGNIATFNQNILKGEKYLFNIIDKFRSLNSKNSKLIFLNVGKSSPSVSSDMINIPLISDDQTLAQVYSAMDIYLTTSIAENCPLSVLEAMACELPIVTFAVGGIPELVRHEKEGMIIDNFNVNAMFETIVMLANNPQMRSYIGKNARQRAITGFSHTNTADAYLSVYHECIDAWHSNIDKIPKLPIESVPIRILTPKFISALDMSDAELVAMGEKAAENNQDEKARICFEFVLKQSPENFYALNKLGVLFFKAKRIELALEYFLKAHYLSPNYSAVSKNLYLLYTAVGDKGKACQYMEHTE